METWAEANVLPVSLARVTLPAVEDVHRKGSGVVKQLVVLMALGAFGWGSAGAQERSDSAGRGLSLEPERRVEFTATEGT